MPKATDRSLNPKEKLYTFYVEGDKSNGNGSGRQFYLVTEKVKVGNRTLTIPKKLGDGNFGVVLEAEDPSNTESYALKVLYEHSVPDDDSGPSIEFEKSRIEAELKIGIDLPRRLKELVDQNRESIGPDFFAVSTKPGDYIVLPIAYELDFDGLQNSEDLSQLDIKLSKYAYLMERFDCSLKDLVEGDHGFCRSESNIHDDKAKASNGENAEIENGSKKATATVIGGYARLAQAMMKERERSAIPVLEQVAIGLQTLHAASFRHRDLKPANIYYKRAANKVQFRLGDLGFLDPKDDPARAGSVVVTQAINIGTKHYRSIEQIDFSDTAECEVEVGESSKEAVLVTRDPKFLETNIEVGDLAFFAKSNSRRHVTIKSITKDSENREVIMHVELSQPPGIDQKGNHEANVLINDRNTQVSFLKNPTAKTDLFGMAAILYDILSVGDSPERFYELLRRFDSDGFSIEESIVRQYATWQAGIIDDADVSAIFSRLNDGEGRSGTVNPQVIRFLLKCMMSNASDSYYREFDFSNADHVPDEGNNFESNIAAIRAWAKVIQEIKSLENVLDATSYNEAERNVLTRSKGFSEEDREEPLENAKQARLSDVLRCYRYGQGPLKKEDGLKEGWNSEKEILAARWVLSAGLITKMDEKLNHHMATQENTYMYSLAQEHLAVNSDSVVLKRSVLDSDEDSLVSSMRYRDPLLTRIRPFSHRFEPIWWRFGTRRIMVAVKDDQLRDSEKTERKSVESVAVDIEYADFAFSRQEARKGDFVLPTAGGSSLVFRVSEEASSECPMRLKVFPHDGRTSNKISFDDNGDQVKIEDVRTVLRDGYLVRNPKREDYYAGMLAIYLFHFLVSDGSSTSSGNRDFPACVYGRIQDFPLRFSEAPSETRNSKLDKWQRIKEHTLKLITWLSLGGYYFDHSGNEIESPIEKWRCAHRAVRKWCKHVHDYMGTGDMALDLTRGIGTKDQGFITEAAKNDIEAVSSEEWDKLCEQYTKSAEVVMVNGPDTKTTTEIPGTLTRDRKSCRDRLAAGFDRVKRMSRRNSSR